MALNFFGSMFLDHYRIDAGTLAFTHTEMPAIAGPGPLKPKTSETQKPRRWRASRRNTPSTLNLDRHNYYSHDQGRVIPPFLSILFLILCVTLLLFMCCVFRGLAHGILLPQLHFGMW